MPEPHRFQSLEQRDIKPEALVEPWPQSGFIVSDSPADRQLSLCIQNRPVVELDARRRAEFDMLDVFIASPGFRPDLSADAIAEMGRELAELQLLDHDMRGRPTHKWLGSDSLHASLIEGGQELSRYPRCCQLNG